MLDIQVQAHWLGTRRGIPNIFLVPQTQPYSATSSPEALSAGGNYVCD